MGQPTGLKRRGSTLRVNGQLSQPVLSGLSGSWVDRCAVERSTASANPMDPTWLRRRPS